MRRNVATVIGVLFLLAAGLFYLMSVGTNFGGGYLNPSRSLTQAVERVGEAERQPNTDAYQRLVRTANQTTQYIQHRLAVLRQRGLLNTLTAAAAGLLILLFSRWIPGSQQAPDDRAPSA
jgi:hypothetical protein